MAPASSFLTNAIELQHSVQFFYKVHVCQADQIAFAGVFGDLLIVFNSHHGSIIYYITHRSL